MINYEACLSSEKVLQEGIRNVLGSPLDVFKFNFTFLCEFSIDLIYLNSTQYSEAYLEPNPTSTKEFFCKIS